MVVCIEADGLSLFECDEAYAFSEGVGTEADGLSFFACDEASTFPVEVDTEAVVLLFGVVCGVNGSSLNTRGVPASRDPPNVPLDGAEEVPPS